MGNSTSKLAIVVLAAGQGTRMKSSRAKVLHELCGRSMLGHVLETAEALEPERLLVVVGRGADEVQFSLQIRLRRIATSAKVTS